MRIAIVSNTAWYLFNFRLNLMKLLRDEGHSVIALAPHDEFAQAIEEAGFNFQSLPVMGGGVNPFLELMSVFSLWKVLRRERVDLVFSYTPKGNLYSALSALLAGPRFVPNVSGLGRAFIHKSLVTKVVLVLYKFTLNKAEKVFFQNNDDLRSFVELGLVQREKSERLPGSGVDLNRFSVVAPVLRESQKLVFLLVARMLWDKGVGEFVDAAGVVKKKYPNIRFQLLGSLDADNPSAISKEKVAEWTSAGIVEYLGYTKDVRPYLEDADCVVLPSYREGVPRTLLEAAAISRPIITTDAPGCKDTVIDGVTGFICEVKSSAALANAIELFIKMPAEQRLQMGEKGRQYVEECFDERAVLERYLSVVKFVKSKSL